MSVEYTKAEGEGEPSPTLQDLFRYENGALYWKIGIPGRSANKRAGSKKPNSSGYLRVFFDGKSRLLHRVIWELHNGHIPKGLTIDHKNGDKLDNRIENLRLASLCEQQFNTSSYTGRKGVYFNKAAKKWFARMTAHGVYHWCGSHDTKEEALAAYSNKANELQGEFKNDTL